MNYLFYKMNDKGYYNLYVLVGSQLVAIKNVFKSDFKTIKVAIDSGLIKPLSELHK